MDAKICWNLNAKKCWKVLAVYKCAVAQIWFSEDFAKDHSEFIERLKKEGTFVNIYDDRRLFHNSVVELFSEYPEAMVVSNEKGLFDSIIEKIEHPYIYSMSIEEDMLVDIIPLLFLQKDIASRIENCFSYREGIVYNINTMTEDDFKNMIAQGNDSYDHQVRVDWNGDVYLSTVTAAKNLDGVKFRWETMDAHNQYVGPFAASDDAYIHKEFLALKKNWDENRRGYVDDYFL